MSQISQTSAAIDAAFTAANSLKSKSSTTRKNHGKITKEDKIKLDTNEDWLMIYPRLSVSGLLENVLSNIQLNDRKGRDLYFKLDEEVSTIYNEDMLSKLSFALSSLLDREVIVHISIGQLNSETPSKLNMRLKYEARKVVLENFEQDTNVQKIINHFSGKLSVNSKTPIDEKNLDDRLK